LLKKLLSIIIILIPDFYNRSIGKFIDLTINYIRYYIKKISRQLLIQPGD